MTPRRYRMQARSRSVAETRSRIIQAATELHTERGVLATSWEDVADRAEVAPATVYRHFPSLAELIPACARSVFDIIRPPTLEEAGVKFARLRTPAKRLEILIRDSCHCYAKGEGWLHAARRERDLIPAVGEAVRLQEETLETLVRAATDGLDLSRRDIATLFAFCDFPFYKSLVDAGVMKSEVADVIVDLALGYLKVRVRKLKQS
ncbi:MAG: TetR family transcriptional regulator [Chloroflexi bacterium]|nr:TetR family transcriptional regulator [Chloroflexota bacterium]